MTDRMQWTPSDIPDLTGKTALVTGANSGLGYYSAKHLARAGARVLITTRSSEKGEKALESLAAEPGSGEFEHVVMDLADLESIREAAQMVHSIVARTASARLDVLINNAGIMAPPRAETAQGFELQFGVNHLGHFALTALIKDLLTGSKGSRIVNVSSTAAYPLNINWKDVNWERSYGRYRAYCQSKLANVLFTLELDRRFKKAGAASSAASAHPGLAASNLQKSTVASAGGVFERALYKFLMSRVAQSAEQGSWPQLRAATDPAVEGGEFFGPDQRGTRGFPVEVKTPRNATSENARRLWDISQEMTGIEFEL